MLLEGTFGSRSWISCLQLVLLHRFIRAVLLLLVSFLDPLVGTSCLRFPAVLSSCCLIPFPSWARRLWFLLQGVRPGSHSICSSALCASDSDFPAAGSPWSQSAARAVFLEVFCHQQIAVWIWDWSCSSKAPAVSSLLPFSPLKNSPFFSRSASCA
jgi:hypothetical protein